MTKMLHSTKHQIVLHVWQRKFSTCVVRFMRFNAKTTSSIYIFAFVQ